MNINNCVCGAIARHYWFTRRAGGEFLHYVECNNCGSNFGFHNSESDSIITWNKYQKSISNGI